ncbi:chromosome partitioning protein ParB [Vibrio navarrensis]|nr:chromosome partitioning protein ParB [Vibrio navarrensis]
MKSKSLLTGQSASRTSALTAKQTRTYLSGQVTAKREVVAANDIESKTGIHPLNPRNQDGLTLEAVRDILLSITENGVNQEGVAIKCPETGKYLLLDASRRRFCCIHSRVDLPLWVIQSDVTDEQALKIINDSQEVKRWSYPEHAAYLLVIAQRKQINVEEAKIEDLAQALGMGRESLRKRLEAYNVSRNIIEVFVDFEGIPNSFYSKLAKFEKALVKAGKDIDEEMNAFKSQLQLNEELSSEVSERQRQTLELLDEFVSNAINRKPQKASWETTKLAEFEDKKAYAKVSRSPDRNSVKFELSRIGSEKLRKIEDSIRAILNEEA